MYPTFNPLFAFILLLIAVAMMFRDNQLSLAFAQIAHGAKSSFAGFLDFAKDSLTLLKEAVTIDVKQNTDGTLTLTQESLQALLKAQAEESSEAVIKAAKLDQPNPPPVKPGADDGEKFLPKDNESKSAKDRRLQEASKAIKGGTLTVVHAPKELKTFRYMKALLEGDRQVVNAILDHDYGDNKALVEGSLTDGGNLVPVEFATDLKVAIEEYGISRRDCDVYPMTTNELDLRTVTTKPVVYPVGEKTAPAAEAGTKFGAPKLIAKAFAGDQVMSKEFFRDNNVGAYQRLVGLFGEQFAVAEDSEVFGNNSAWIDVNGNPQTLSFTGVMASAANIITIASQSIADITYKELVKINRSLSKGKLMGGGKYYMHRTILSYIEGITDSNNRPIVINPLGEGTATLFGRPVELSEAMPETDASNSPFIIFGNLRWVAFGDRDAVTAKIFDQATIAGVNLAEQRSLGLLIDSRFGVVVQIPKNITVVKTKA